jgi:bacteriocin-like protein
VSTLTLKILVLFNKKGVDMSNPNENLNPQKNTDSINIDETGKVIINDPELAKMTEELSIEELEQISGGDPVNGNNCPTTNGQNCSSFVSET